MSTRTCMVRICLLFALAFAFPACSDDEVASTNNRPGTDLDVSLDTSPDVPEDPADAPVDTGDDEDATADVDPDEDAESDTDQDVEDPAPRFEICLLGDNPPTSQDCLTEEQLDFGWLPTETLAEQNFRVTNTGLDSFWISDLSITNGGTTDAHFDTITFRLKPNPSNPSAPIQELQTVPARLNAGESLFVTATLMAGTITGTIDSEAVLVELDLNEDEPTTLIIPLIAEIGECATGTMSCDGLAKTGCETNIHDDADNCGTCHNVCNLDNVDSICVEGVCKIDGQCAAGFSDCDKEHANGCETNVTTDDNHCGTCGNACARDNADGFCGGASGCDITCHDNFDDCNQDLFAYASDGCETFLPESVDHCGACGNKCVLNNATPGCSDSACIIDSCNDGYDNCDGSDANGCEIHIDADVNNCGACGNKCELPNAIAKCTDGGCEIASCHTGYSDCDGDPTNGCEVNLTNDADHCGTCNNECNLAGGSSICVNSTCRVNTCNDGLANCSTDPGAGCQTNIHEDVNNCGACGQVCNLPNAGATCSLGACKIDTCNIGYDSCDANDLTGCETNLNTNVNHCGECGNQCNLPNAVSKCTDGGCEIASCHAGWSDCDGDPSNGCETDLNDVNSCGACNNVCELDNASASCTNQKCTVLSCDAGYSNCNGDHADGCETNLKADDFNCGTCGNTCNLPNAGSTCIEGSCAVTSCTPGFGDCTAAAGCETNLLSSTSHCGGCNIACSFPNAAPVCLGGTCDIGACLGDFQNCDNQLANGCESNIQSDVNNCGGCGIACNLPNANPICTDGGCQIGSCHAGFSDCDGDPSNGCEVNLNTDVNHCGSCNNACELDDATATCQNGNCRIDSCDQGFASCDNNHANGCEIDIYTDNNNCGACGQTCEIPNSVAQCQAPGTCAFVECLPGYLDLNNNLTDGCEYQCTPTPGEDRPGDITTSGYNWMQHDSNCDGIDGDAARAIFVATDGNDNAAGTRQAPMRTIQAAINRIKNSSSGQDQIYVSEGTYTEQITLEPGISIYGGFSRTEGWKRSSEYVSEIYRTTSDTNQNVVAVKGNNIPVNSSAPTVLQNMKIRSGNATGRFNNGINGASSYGIHCVGCAGLELRSNEITAGTGAPGQAGAAGTRGNNGANGSPGGNGDPDGSNRGAGGARGLSCSAGGNGGMGGERGNNPGVAGSPGSGGASGGSGGAGGGCCNYVGKAGGDGSTGGSTNTRGIGGSGAASLDLISNNYWQGASGSAGGQGSHGHGGGGGGGGGGQGAVWGFGHLHGSGNGGGGGGGGGCGGNGGQGGGAGGSSFGIFLINSTGITLLNNIISTDAGGKGGNGGTGGASGAGGIGGLGGAHKLDEIGKGGNGGNGGTGGPGGYGGGGAGGHSIPVMYRNTSLPSVLTNNTLIPGAAGARGTSSAGGNSNGAAGRAQATHSF